MSTKTTLERASKPLPDNWQAIQLKNKLILEYGKGLPEEKRIPGRYPVYGSNGIVGYHQRRLVDGPGIVVGRKGTVGAVTFADSDFWPIDTTYFVELKDDATSLRWLFYRLRTLGLASLNTATGVPGLNRDLVYSLSVAWPSFAEQLKIADILFTVDRAINGTETLIRKLRQIMQGLMQDLLTRGIDEKGNIRSEKTHQFKDSPLGRIPEGWEVKLLDRLAERGSGHTPDKSHPNYWNGGIKWVSLADSDKLDQIYITDTAKEISTLGLRHSSAVLHPAGTVILSRDAGVGKSAILASDMAVSQHFMAWRCGSKMNNHYLYYWLQKDKPRFEAIAFGSTIVTIGLPFFKQYSIAVPSLVREQEMIVERLLSAEATIKAEEAYGNKLLPLKSGLMGNLLSGEVRVDHLLKQ